MGFSNNWVFCLTLPPSSFKGTSSETLFKLRCWKSDGSLGDVLAGWGEEARSKKATNRKMLVAIVQANFFLALPAKGGSPVGGDHVKELEGERGGSDGLLSGSEAGTDCNRVPWLV